MDWVGVIRQVHSLLENQEGLKAVFSWQGKTCHGVKTALRREDVATDAGLAGDYTFSLLCPAGQFDGVPLPRPRLDKLEVDGQQMRVLAVEQDSVKATLRLHLGSVTE
ncbi:MAG: hypothetical protein J5746_12205 [Victivallales bacterium]|nr:hypothetical protein [Victivallales bacterium]